MAQAGGVVMMNEVYEAEVVDQAVRNTEDLVVKMRHMDPANLTDAEFNRLTTPKDDPVAEGIADRAARRLTFFTLAVFVAIALLLASGVGFIKEELKEEADDILLVSIDTTFTSFIMYLAGFLLVAGLFTVTGFRDHRCAVYLASSVYLAVGITITYMGFYILFEMNGFSGITSVEDGILASDGDRIFISEEKAGSSPELVSARNNWNANFFLFTRCCQTLDVDSNCFDSGSNTFCEDREGDSFFLQDSFRTRVCPVERLPCPADPLDFLEFNKNMLQEFKDVYQLPISGSIVGGVALTILALVGFAIGYLSVGFRPKPIVSESELELRHWDIAGTLQK